jgi:hypothetical protein
VTGVRTNDVRSSDVRTSGGRENVRVLPRQDADG